MRPAQNPTRYGLRGPVFAEEARPLGRHEADAGRAAPRPGLGDIANDRRPDNEETLPGHADLDIQITLADIEERARRVLRHPGALVPAVEILDGRVLRQRRRGNHEPSHRQHPGH